MKSFRENIHFFKSEASVLKRYSETIQNNGYNKRGCRIHFRGIISAANKTLSEVCPRYFRKNKLIKYECVLFPSFNVN